MTKLFENFKINNLTLKNRFLLSAAADNLNDNLDARIVRFAKFAKGSIGLIVSGALTLNAIKPWEKVIKAVHDAGGKIALQIMVRGGPGITPWSPDDEEKIAVSAIPEDSVYFHSFIKYGKHRAALEEELTKIITTYAQTAKLAKDIGADAVQVHAAHQNFLSQFLSPITNKRTDRWGGSVENRTRMHREVIKAIRKTVGDDFPVLIKLGVEDAFEKGLKFEDGKIAVKLIAESGCDALEISQGLQNIDNWGTTSMRTNIKNIADEGYFRNWSKEIKKIVSKPVIVTGGIRSFELAEEIIKNQEADMIGMCRPFIREPGLINRWESGDHKKATCVSCNKCITELLVQGKPLECFLDMKQDVKRG